MVQVAGVSQALKCTMPANTTAACMTHQTHRTENQDYFKTVLTQSKNKSWAPTYAQF
jgi:hypothetical protein